MEHVQAMRDGMRAGIDQVMTCQPTHVIMGVALEAFWGGAAAADELQAELTQRSGVGVSMGSTATVAALRAFGARNIAVLTPHQLRTLLAQQHDGRRLTHRSIPIDGLNGRTSFARDRSVIYEALH